MSLQNMQKDKFMEIMARRECSELKTLVTATAVGLLVLIDGMLNQNRDLEKHKRLTDLMKRENYIELMWELEIWRRKLHDEVIQINALATKDMGDA